MDLDSIRTYCLSFGHATEDIQWGNDLLFRIGGKIFAAMNLNPPHQLSFKCTSEAFDELIELESIIPAPYMARNKWVMLERLDALTAADLKKSIGISYELVFSKLPRKVQSELGGAAAERAATRKPRGKR